MIDTQTLKTIAKARSLSQSDLARLAGVSRQAVSLWFKGAHAHADVHAKHLLSLSHALGLSVEDITTPLPCSGPEESAALRAGFLWDRLYTGIDDFAVAVSNEEPKALARLVQVCGLFGAAKAAGPAVWTKFERYKNHIHPMRRMELEKLWLLRQRRTSN
jgi:transcriptional regulator with XRE-family HTH domain